jgi:lipoate---protein ligase
MICDSLKQFGIAAEASGRNDITTTDGLKVSGSAYKLSGSRACHHGTTLIDVDMDQLAKYLNPNKEKLKVRSCLSE